MTRARMLAALVTEWEANGWPWDLQIGSLILDGVEKVGHVDARRLAQSLPTSYLTRYGTDRDGLEEAISRAIGAEGLEPEQRPESAVVINGDTYNFKLEISGEGTLEGSPINIGPGTQVNVDVEASRDDVLIGIETLIRAGFAGEWNPDAAAALDSVIGERGDIAATDVKELTERVGGDVGPSEGRIRSLMQEIVKGAATSTLAAGLSAGLGALLSSMPL